MAQPDPKKVEETQEFFELIYGKLEGYAELVTLDEERKPSSQKPMKLPDDLYRMAKVSAVRADEDVYCSVAVFTSEERTGRDTEARVHAVWAEADTAHPSVFRIPPTIVVNTSPGRYHVWWVLDRPVAASEASKLAKKIYLAHKEQGVDSGFAVSKILRVPGTSNTKYGKDWTVTAEIDRENILTFDTLDAAYADISIATGIEQPESEEIDLSAFTHAELHRLKGYAETSWRNDLTKLDKEGYLGWEGEGWDNTTFQAACNLLRNAYAEWSPYTEQDVTEALLAHAPQDEGFTEQSVLDKLESARHSVEGTSLALPEWAVDRLTVTLPDIAEGDELVELEALVFQANASVEYSEALHPEETLAERITLLIERLSAVAEKPEDVFSLVMNANVVKHATVDVDKHSIWSQVQTYSVIGSDEKPKAKVRRITFLTDKERARVKECDFFPERYTRWVASRTDSSETYQRSWAFMLLSCVYGDKGTLPMRWNSKTRLNLWLLTLGDTTRTRKTTAKDIFLDVLSHYQNMTGDIVHIGEDSSAESLGPALAKRDGLVSLQVKEEVNNWLDQVTTKQWRGGEKGEMTKFYDGRVPVTLRQTKGLGVEKEATTVFNFGGVGIRTEVNKIVTRKDFQTGFLTRALWSVADPEPRQKWSGDMDLTREGVMRFRQEMSNQGMGGADEIARDLFERSKILSPDRPWEIFLSKAANSRNNKWKEFVTSETEKFGDGEVLEAAVERLTISVLKSAALLALYDNVDEVSLDHMLCAIEQAERWYNDLVRMVNEVSSSDFERRLQEVELYILQGSDSIRHDTDVRKKFARWKPREIDEILDALTAQGRIRRVKDGIRRGWEGLE